MLTFPIGVSNGIPGRARVGFLRLPTRAHIAKAAPESAGVRVVAGAGFAALRRCRRPCEPSGRLAGRRQDPFWRLHVWGGIGWHARRPHDILHLPHERRWGRERTPRPFGRRVRFGKSPRRLDLASRGTYENIPEIGILWPAIPLEGNL